MNKNIIRIIITTIILSLLFVGCSSHTYRYLSILKADNGNSIVDNKCSIAIIDTGINPIYCEEHKNNIINKYNVLDGTQNVEDEHGHGTEMVSIILGDYENDLLGINPNAQIMIIKAVGKSGKTDNSNIAKSIDYLLKLNDLPDIISLSLGSLNDDTCLQEKIHQAINAGIIVVAAVGDYEQKDILYPAAYNGVVSVQAMDCNNNIAPMSNVSDLTTLSFFGVDINVLSFENEQRIIRKCSGSSVATALASGYFSLFISNCRNNNLDITYDIFMNHLLNNIDSNKILNYNHFIKMES